MTKSLTAAWCWLAILGGCTKAPLLSAKSQDRIGPGQAPARSVSFRTTQKGPYVETVPFLGVLMPSKVVSLHFAVGGRLDQCFVKNGDLVPKGAPICALDSSVVDLEVERARAARQAARKIVDPGFAESQRELFESGVIGQVDYEKVRVQSESAGAAERDANALLELALKKRAEHMLRAPWDGRISGLSLAPGQLLTPDVTVGYLGAASAARSPSAPQVFRVELKLHARWFGTVQPGDRAELTQLAGRMLETPLEAKVTETASEIVPETQMFGVNLELTQPDSAATAGALAQGMLVKGNIRKLSSEATLVIPAASVVEWDHEDNGRVFVIGADDRLRLRTLKLGRYNKDQIVVREGLEIGERLVESWAPGLYEGLAVKPVSEDTLSEGPAPNPKKEQR